MYMGYIGTTPNGISIHALVKRATKTNLCNGCSKGISIHALVKRATLLAVKMRILIMAFQSTPS